MEYITLNNGLQMPTLGLGVYQLHGKECEQYVLDAINIGYRLFDTAQMYGNEKDLGNAIKKCNIKIHWQEVRQIDSSNRIKIFGSTRDCCDS